MSTQLPDPARYFPLDKPLYEVAPGLKTWGTSFGNGAADQKAFQLDSDFPRYRASTLEARRERVTKYVQSSGFPPEVERTSTQWMIDQLVLEHPEHFMRVVTERGHTCLECRLTGETLVFDAGGVYLPELSKTDVTPPYISALDALRSQVQEDIAIQVRRRDPETGELKDWLAAIALSSPSHWAAEDKIGKSFFAIHAPIPGVERMNKAAASLVDAMIHKGPYVRFVWGFATDTRLNHHPVPAPGVDAATWKGRSFDLERKPSPFTMRVERQVIWGLPEVEASMFLIRVSFREGVEIRANEKERELLKGALLSMNESGRIYKGVEGNLEPAINWLSQI